jgi:hypothetical protein
VRTNAQVAQLSGGLPFRIFLPDDETCEHCEGRGSLSQNCNTSPEDLFPEDWEYIGTVVSCAPGKNSANLLLDGILHSGERIMVIEEDGEREIEVEWMQWGKAWVHLALRGWMVTIPTTERLSAGARVFRAA